MAINIWGNVGNEAFALPLAQLTPTIPSTQGWMLGWDLTNQVINYLPLAYDTTALSLLFNGTGGLGYTTGAGGSVVQATSRATGVTLNKPCGSISMFSAAGSAVAASFTVTNSKVAVGDIIKAVVRSATNKYLIFVTAVAAGSFEFTFFTTGGTAVDAPIIDFAVMKGVSA